MSMMTQFIGGELVSGHSAESIDVHDPATGQLIAQVNAASAGDVDAAVAVARNAFDRGEWQSRSIHDRADTLWAFADKLATHADELAELEVRDNGMPLPLARALVGSAEKCVRYHAGIVSKIHGITTDLSSPGQEIHAYTRLEPVGVVAAITPWNAPFAILVAKIAAALAAGCSIVCKPAEQTPLSATRLGELLQKWKLFP
jgi:phenylacetaldehyde dehydrogenase